MANDNHHRPDEVADAQEPSRSPISLLSQDVIQEIFLHCVPMDCDAAMNMFEPPMLLSQICSNWRAIALSSPRLWSSIHIPIPICEDEPGTENYTKIYPDPKGLCEAISTWLNRSGVRPLSISVTEMDLGGLAPVSLMAIPLIMETLVNYSSRWKSIHLSLPDRAWNILAHQPLPEMLEILSLNLSRAPAFFAPQGQISRSLRRIYFAGDWYQTKLLQSPRLRDLSIYRSCSHLDNFALNWSQLTDLSLGVLEPFGSSSPYVSISAAYSILDKCQNLKSCSINVMVDDEDDGVIEHLPMITMPSLTTFEVGELEHFSLAPFFRHLHLPSLCHLGYASRRVINAWEPVNALSYLLKESKLVETLFLDTMFMKGHHLLDILRLVPNVRRISFVGCQLFLGQKRFSDDLAFERRLFLGSEHLRDDIMKHLIPGASSIGVAEPCLCPLLEVFECDQGEFTQDYLYLFIKKRIDDPQTAMLKRVRIAFGHRRARNIEAELQDEIRQSGLDLTLIYPQY